MSIDSCVKQQTVDESSIDKPSATIDGEILTFSKKATDLLMEWSFLNNEYFSICKADISISFINNNDDLVLSFKFTKYPEKEISGEKFINLKDELAKNPSINIGFLNKILKILNLSILELSSYHYRDTFWFTSFIKGGE